MNENETQALIMRANEIRIDIVSMIAKAGSGHVGGSLSAADILTVLFFKVMRHDPKIPQWEDRDRFILSKGHAAPLLYAVLAKAGYFPREWLDRFSANGSQLQKHPDRQLVPGIEVNTGALGQGLSVGVGVALDGKLRKKDYRVYVVIGDGECDEGQIWEAAMAAAHYKLDNLTAFVDNNQLQVDGTNDEVMKLSPLDDKWRAFGWDVQVVDGHKIEKIMGSIQKASEVSGKPSMIVAKTIKGKGVSFAENRVEWHAKPFTPEQAKLALSELMGVNYEPVS